jgi:hypothetical protein
MSASAYDMHANWRAVEPRTILRQCRTHGGTITKYAKNVSRFGSCRSYIVSWSVEGCEGYLYVLRVQTLARFEREKMRALAA